jgi:hypothetical protein
MPDSDQPRLSTRKDIEDKLEKVAQAQKLDRLELFTAQKTEADALVAELTHVPGRWFECPAFISPYPMPGRGPGGVEYSYGLSIARFDFYQGGEPDAQMYVRAKVRPVGLPGDPEPEWLVGQASLGSLPVVVPSCNSCNGGPQWGHEFTCPTLP